MKRKIIDKKPLFVTEPFLPPFAEYQERLKGIWERNHLTNNGPLVKELEERIPAYLNSCPMLFLGNGTIAIQIALKALDITGEVITTPFSYVATTSSLVWEGCTPVFADIDPLTWNIDPVSIERMITPKTQAILATHVFGNPCDVHAIQAIADKHGLKVIYDAAHAFASEACGNSIFDYGDASTASFHATKLFHTIEGGAVFSRDEKVRHRMSYMRNFGHSGPESFSGVGINGKNSEFHAAMGCVNLDYIDMVLEKRKLDCGQYVEALDGAGLIYQRIDEGARSNHSYFPVLFKEEAQLVQVMEVMAKENVVPRRYFYPCLNQLDYVTKGHTPIAAGISSRILCLPLSYQLKQQEIEKVVRIIKSCLR